MHMHHGPVRCDADLTISNRPEILDDIDIDVMEARLYHTGSWTSMKAEACRAIFPL